MKGSISKNLIFAVLALAIVGVAGYFYMTRDRISDSDLLVGSPAENVATVDNDLLSALRDLKTLQLDETIFDDAAFRSLANFSISINPQPAGRPNPFAPIPGLVTTSQNQGQ